MSTTALQESLNTPDASALLERVVMHNDLSALTPRERVGYIRTVCQSLGLNPLTNPFRFLRIQKDLQLYATKDCAEQLRKLHAVSVRIVSAGTEGDVFIVRVEATDKAGRADADLGAVSIAGLRGEALSNAMMKAVTKSKRRCTLSICGLGFLDESEVDSIPHATPVNVDMETGEILDPPSKLDAFAKTLGAPPPPPPSPGSPGDLFGDQAPPADDTPPDTRLECQLALTAIGRHLGTLQLSAPMLAKLLKQHCGIDRTAQLDDVSDPAALGALLADLDVLARTRKDTQERTRKISHRPEPNT